MTTNLAGSKQPAGFRGRPPASVEHRVNANMDVIAQARTDEVELQKLQAQEVLARRDCRCADQRLHAMDCALREILARKGELIRPERSSLSDWETITTKALADGAAPRTECLWLSPSTVAALHPRLLA